LVKGVENLDHIEERKEKVLVLEGRAPQNQDGKASKMNTRMKRRNGRKKKRKKFG